MLTILFLSLSVIGFAATSAMALTCRGCGNNTMEVAIADYNHNNLDYGYPDTRAKFKAEDALDITFVVADDHLVNVDSCKNHDTVQVINTSRKGFKSCDDIGADTYVPENIDNQKVLTTQ